MTHESLLRNDLNITCAQLAMTALLLPGRVFGSELRPYRHRFAALVAFESSYFHNRVLNALGDRTLLRWLE